MGGIDDDRSHPPADAAVLDLSPWAPLRNKIFFALFVAQLVSNLGTLMQSVGAAWLIGDLGGTAAEVALVQTMTFLPAFLVGIPAGALADVFDRRKVLMATQASMLLSAALMAVLTFADLLRPTGVLALTFMLGHRRGDDESRVVGDPTRPRPQGAIRPGRIARLDDLQRRPRDRPAIGGSDHRRRRDRMGLRDQRPVLPRAHSLCSAIWNPPHAQCRARAGRDAVGATVAGMRFSANSRMAARRR